MAKSVYGGLPPEGLHIAWCGSVGNTQFCIYADLSDPISGAAALSAYTSLDISATPVDQKQNRSRPIQDGQDWTHAIEAYQAMRAYDLATAIKLYERHACIACRRKRNHQVTS